MLREKLEVLLPANLGRWRKLAGLWRGRAKQRLTSISERRRFWEKTFGGRFSTQVANGAECTGRTTARTGFAPLRPKRRKYPGRDSLGGAGDVGLLTLRGLQLMQQAEVVLYDHLVSDEILDLVRRDAERICVGKRAGAHSVIQEEINRLLLALAQ